MKSIEATPTPALLVWARESAGFDADTVAGKLKIPVSRLLNWENGTERPTLSQLRRLTVVYKRPLAVFYLANPPKGFETMHDFRHIAGTGGMLARSPELSYEIRRARDRREWAVELFEELGEAPPPFVFQASQETSPEIVAQEARRFLGITFAEQVSWRDQYAAFGGWRHLLERSGILVFQTSILPLSEARGFAISAESLPAVIVNNKDQPRGRIFTLLHEFTHLALRNGGVCDLEESSAPARRTDSRVETFCNRVAGAVIFPADEFLQSDVVRQHQVARGSKGRWSDAEIATLSRSFGGSREAVLVRMLALGLTDQAFYEEKKAQFIKEYAEVAKREGGFAPPHSKALASAGPLFTELVLRNFNLENITSSDLSDFLQVRLKHLGKIQRAIADPISFEVTDAV